MMPPSEGAPSRLGGLVWSGIVAAEPGVAPQSQKPNEPEKQSPRQQYLNEYYGDRIARYVKITVKVVSAVVILCAAAVAGILCLNWYVERRAHEFCDEIAIGSDISAATARAKERKVFWGPAGGYTFYFPGFAFDKAVCAVSVDQGGKVVSKHSEMEYD